MTRQRILPHLLPLSLHCPRLVVTEHGQRVRRDDGPVDFVVVNGAHLGRLNYAQFGAADRGSWVVKDRDRPIGAARDNLEGRKERINEQLRRHYCRKRVESILG